RLAVARDWSVGAGVAPGLTDGAGSPAVRIVAALQYWPAVEPPPTAPAPTSPVPAPAAPPRATSKPVPPAPKPLPPPPDNDLDGIPDSEDACPAEPGEPS